jgi:hypothetical protein
MLTMPHTQLEWPFDRCIFCRNSFVANPSHQHRRTDSHVIPESLGGNLSTTALCFTCNSRSGTRFEASLPLDPTLRGEIQRFAHLVSDFDKQRRKAGRKWEARGDDAVFRMKLDESGEWRMMDSPQSDGSRFKDSRDAAAEVENRLREGGADPDEIERVLASFTAGREVQVGPDTYRPHTGDLTIELVGTPADDRAFLAIAMHFLACAIGDRVLMNDFEGVRRVLTGVDQGHNGSWAVVPQTADRESAPWHRLMIVQGDPIIAVDVCLFGRWRYLVLFLGVRWNGPRMGLAYDLETGALEARRLDADQASS